MAWVVCAHLVVTTLQARLGYAGSLIFYDVMGRVSQQTSPAEINASWVPSGDDSDGWVSSTQTYDWNGRPVRTTNPDASYRENTYGGCGCAGGEQITARDERGRRKRYTKDVLGRLSKGRRVELERNCLCHD